MIFELVDIPADGRLAGIHLPSDRGQRTGLDDPDECTKRLYGVHDVVLFVPIWLVPSLATLIVERNMPIMPARHLDMQAVNEPTA
jgi:hypothetical protein